MTPAQTTAIAALVVLTQLASGQVEPAGPPAQPLSVVYFYSPTCVQCARAVKAIDAVERKYAGRVRVERHSISEPKGLDLLFAYEDLYHSEESAPPKVFIGKQYLHGADAILERLDAVVAQELKRLQPPAEPNSSLIPEPNSTLPPASDAIRPAPAEPNSPASDPNVSPPAATVPTQGRMPSPSPAPRPQVGEGLVLRKFQSYGLAAVAVAGLVDGVNPCAFTTIVFLLSAVAYVGKTRRQVAIVGVTFTLAVFLTYLLLGVGLLLAIKEFAVHTGLTQWLTWIVAGLAFVLAAWSLWDGIRTVASGKIPRFSLGLPSWIKAAIRRVIRTGLKGRYLFAGSFLVGCLVSLLESFCTGQVYVPTIMVVLHMPGQRMAAFGYLLLYNVAFILPLAVIMVMAYFGVRSERLGNLLRRHLGLLKFALAGLFAGLGFLLLAV